MTVQITTHQDPPGWWYAVATCEGGKYCSPSRRNRSQALVKAIEYACGFADEIVLEDEDFRKP